MRTAVALGGGAAMEPAAMTQHSTHCGVQRGMVGDLIKAKCRIYYRQIAAG
jgi:hypothetical protein